MLYAAIVAALGFCTISAAQAAESPASVEYLRCEYHVDPLGIDITQPRLSWEMNDARRGAKQTAYQILVASSPEKLAADRGDLWDSGRVESDQSTQIVYAGQPLVSRMQCHWKVRLWDADGHATAYGKPAVWTMGLLAPADVQGKWIGLNGPMVDPRAKVAKPVSLDDCVWVWTKEPGIKPLKRAPVGARFFRKTLSLPEGRTVRRAMFGVGADDQWQVFVNGTEVGNGMGHRMPKEYDVARQLKAGENCLAIRATNLSESPAGLYGKLVVEFEQGEPLVAFVDGGWKASVKEMPKWEQPGFDDSGWPAALQLAKFSEMSGEKIRIANGSLHSACPLFRKEFKVAGEIRRATLHASALGVYRMYVNGKPVGNDYFTPDWTDYKKRLYYNTYDVTELVRDGGNAIGGVLGAGWYSGAIGWELRQNNYGDRPRLFAQLEIELADGTRQTIVSDESWKTAFGPYREGEFLAGETYDATREIPGWAEPGLDDAAWSAVAVGAKVPPKFQAFPGVTVRETSELRPIKVAEPKPGVFVFDLGQNFAGFARLKVQGPAGTKVVLRFAEMLNPDGTVYTLNLRGARVTDTYVLKGQGEEVWQPRFTFHGFRYVEVTGYPGRPTEDAITGVAINSDVPLTGSFECSSPMVTKLYQNIVWTQRANFISVPTDCPQRDERLGWMGDAAAFVRAAVYNADTAAFYTKWLFDVDDAQTPDGEFPNVAPRVVTFEGGVAAWADAGTICPTTVYRAYGDKRLLAEHYPAMVRWVEYCRKHSRRLLRPAHGYGDWLSINANTPLDVIATAFFAHSTRLTADAARVLGKDEDAKKYDALFEQIKAAFNRAYGGSDAKIKGNTQTCYVLALRFDLLPPAKRAAATRLLVNDIKSRDAHLSTGFVGTSQLMPTLSSVGQTPLAYKLLLNDTFPSWGYSIKHGATSIWERWDGWTSDKGFQNPGMNSFAHYSFGAVAQWMFQTVAGIDTVEPGFQRLLIRPQPAEGLTWVKAGYRSIHGPIAVEWRIEDGGLKLHVALPANTTATVCVPTSDPSAVTEGGQPAAEVAGVKALPAEGGEARFELGAGDYQFAAPWKK